MASTGEIPVYTGKSYKSVPFVPGLLFWRTKTTLANAARHSKSIAEKTYISLMISEMMRINALKGLKSLSQ
jgi:hypothetical protein